jgi:hypothetical protein
MDMFFLVCGLLVVLVGALIMLGVFKSKTPTESNRLGGAVEGEDSGVLYVTLHTAKNLPDMDYFGGKSDPYVVLMVDGVERARSETFEDESSPVFDQDFTIKLFGKPKELKFQVWDEDKFKRDDKIGAATFDLQQLYDGKKLNEEEVSLKKESDNSEVATMVLSLSYVSTTPVWHPNPNSKKKALVIGINYLDKPKGDGGLDGCVHDAHEFSGLLKSHFGFEEEHIRLLVDDENPNKRTWPTKKNILDGIHWLTHGARPGDSLVFNYSGHGTQVKDRNKDEEDGMDEALCPCDQDKAGVIIDDELKKLLCDRVPDGVRVTCVIDCCHSGSILDLPFTRVIYETSKNEFRENSENMYMAEEESDVTEKHKPEKKKSKAEMLHAAPSRVGGRRRRIRGKVHGFHQAKAAAEAGPKDIICISGCEDSDVSVGSQFGGESYGAMTWSFLQVMKHSGGNITYAELIMKIRQLIVHRKFKQVPQLSTLRPFDINEKFIL